MADFETALAHHGAGRIELAKAGYENVLRLDRHSEALEELRQAEGMIELSTDEAAAFRVV